MAGIILRGITETYNDQIHLESNSLTQNMRKHFEVKRKSFDIWANKNKFVSFLYATNRVNMGAAQGRIAKPKKSISDNAYRVAYRGNLFIPTYATGSMHCGAFSTDANLPAGVTYETGYTEDSLKTDDKVTIGVKHDPANNIFGNQFGEGDVIMLGDWKGPQIIVAGTPVLSNDETHYKVNGKLVGTAGLFLESYVADGELLIDGGNRMGEGSLRGNQRDRRWKWEINYSFITRVTLTMTGSAQSQKVINFINSETGAKLWEYEEVVDLYERHAVNIEQGCRYARTTMDASSHQWFENYGTNKLTLDGFTANMGLVAPVIGDGWITQLEDSLTISYDPNADLPIDKIENFMTILAQRSPAGSTGNTFVILGDKLAHMKLDKAFKALIGWTSDGTSIVTNTNIVQDVKTGEDIKIGFTISKYSYLDNECYFIEDELRNHPAFAPQNGGIIGTGDMFWLNATVINGVSNIDVLSRSDRQLRAKYIDGMHSLDKNNNNGKYAASGFDGSRLDLLSEILPIIYSTESCGILKASAKYTGGPLSGEAVASENVTTWHY